MNIDNLLTHFTGVKPCGEGYRAICPAHDDKISSLSINMGDDKVLLHCHAQCPPEAVLGAVGLKMSDLYIRQTRGSVPTSASAVYEYKDEMGKLLYQVLRYNPKNFKQRRPGNGSWQWNLNRVRRVPYRLQEVIRAINAGETIYIVEGEKDVHSLEHAGLTATCNAGGAGNWHKSMSQCLQGAKVVILPDNDNPGQKHAQSVAENLHGIASSIKVVNLPGLPAKGDVTDWIQAGHTKQELLALVESAPVWTLQQSQVDCKQVSYAQTESGNAELFISRHRSQLRYAKHLGKWLVWNEQYWKPDNNGHVTRLALETVRSRYNELKDSNTDNERDRLFNFIKSSESRYKLNALLEIAKDLDGVTIQAHDVDSNSWLLNCLNGTIDLETGVLNPHNHQDLLTKQIPVNYSQSAGCPRWEQFLNEVFAGDEGLIDFVHKAVGYSLTGDTREQCFFILHGSGSNGKSVFIDTLQTIMGEYSTATTTDTLLEKPVGSIPNDIARLNGMRLVTASETTAGRRLAEGLVKQLTGGDKMTARFLHQEYFDFKPDFKLWLACNHLPVINGNDFAIMRRIHVIPFDVRFNKPDESPEEPHIDSALTGKLRAEAEGILRWAVQGCLKWQTDGLEASGAIRRATSSYQAEMDILGNFIADCCIVIPHARTSVSDMYEAYSKWCFDNGESLLSQRSFGITLAHRRICQSKRGTGGRSIWQGIGLRELNHTEDDTTEQESLIPE